MKELKGTNNDFTQGEIISIREVRPSQELVRGFYGTGVGARRDKDGYKNRMKMAILFHAHTTIVSTRL